MKKIIEDESESIEIKYTGLTLDALIARILLLRETVPGHAVVNSWVDGYDDDEIHMNFVFKREETDEEYLDRITKEGWERKRIADDEREMYRRLKAKFEVN